MRKFALLFLSFLFISLFSFGEDIPPAFTADDFKARREKLHRTSHYLGIDVHDAGDYDAPLEPGVVLTIEPGIYIKEENIGVRIEDDVLVTDDGYEVLSGILIPREASKIESVLKGRQ